MAHLGEVGEINPASEDTFTFGGHVIRVNPEFSELALIDFMEKAQQVEEGDPEAITMVKNLFRALVHPGDFDTFWGACHRTRQTAVSLVKLYSGVIEAMAGRPSPPPSDSSPGRRLTDVTLKDASYLEVLDQTDGRPDLQAVALKHREESHRG